MKVACTFQMACFHQSFDLQTHFCGGSCSEASGGHQASRPSTCSAHRSIFPCGRCAAPTKPPGPNSTTQMRLQFLIYALLRRISKADTPRSRPNLVLSYRRGRRSCRRGCGTDFNQWARRRLSVLSWYITLLRPNQLMQLAPAKPQTSPPV